MFSPSTNYQCGCGVSGKAARFPVTCLCGAIIDQHGRKIGSTPTSPPPPPVPPCEHLGKATGETIPCGGCNNQQLAVYACHLHGETVLRKPVIKPGHPIWNGRNCLTCRAKQEHTAQP